MTAWILMEHCGDCNLPTRQFHICVELGHNPGVDGHLFKSEAVAREAMGLFDTHTDGAKCAARGVRPYEIKLS